MEENNYKKLIDIGEGKAIYKIGTNLLREQDINARVMDIDVFDRLVSNIKKYGMESMPLVYKKTNPSGNTEFYIISGHHRTRACRSANLKEIECIVYEKELTEDEIRSKQLAHNSLNGFDDENTLKKIYDMIEDISFKIETGIKDDSFKKMAENIKIDEINIDMSYELINILFLKSDYDRFNEILPKIEKEADIYIADKKDFDKFKKQCQQIARQEKIKNMAAIMVKMIEIIQEHYKNKE